MNTHTLALLLIFYNMLYYLWIIAWMKNGNTFQETKVQPQGAA